VLEPELAGIHWDAIGTILLGVIYSDCLVRIENDFMFNSTITKNIQRPLNTTETGTKHTISSAYSRSVVPSQGGIPLRGGISTL